MDFKLTINDSKTGKSFKKEVKDDQAKVFEGLKIGDAVRGESFDLTGYEFKITGGSDNCGFPMRSDVQASRKKILAIGGVGFRDVKKGVRQRKTVCGNEVRAKISQINLLITKYGKDKLEPAAEAKEEKK
jgi:small subunit ribosomal protein S6e